jgi:hypothetical protein
VLRSLYASRLIMRHEDVTKEPPCQVQTGCRYVEGRQQASELVSEHVPPDPRAEGRTYGDDEDA